VSSKRRLRRKSCAGKQRFTSAAETEAGIRKLKAAKGDRSWFNVYHCKFCKGYHFGHAPGSNRIPGR